MTTFTPLAVGPFLLRIAEIHEYGVMERGEGHAQVAKTTCVDLHTGLRLRLDLYTDVIRFGNPPADDDLVERLRREYGDLTVEQENCLSGTTTHAVAHLIPGLELPDPLTSEDAAAALVDIRITARLFRSHQ